VKFDLDLSELENINDRLKDLQLKAEDFDAAAPGIRLLLQEDVDLRFQSSPNTETGGDVWGGEKWAPLSRVYLASHPYRLNGQILRDTGELQQSFTAEGSYEIEGKSIVFGSALPKAGHLARKRPIVFWHPVLLEKVADYLTRYMSAGS